MRSQFWNASARAAVLGLLLTGCGRVDVEINSPQQNPRLLADIARTSYGVPHVRAESFRGLGYGLAYAYAQDNICMFADTILTVNGERSRYFGGEALATQASNGEYGAASDYVKLKNEDSDFFFKSYIDMEQQRAAYLAGSAEGRDLLAGYVAGYNRYLRDASGRLPAACASAAWVRPITLDDMIRVLAEKALHASGEVFAQEIVNAARAPGVVQVAKLSGKPRTRDLGFMQRRLDKLTSEQLGSNGIGIGRDLSATGAGLLLGNPHYPWTSTDRFYQAHLTVPGRYDAMGVVLGGIPMIVIGFNKDIAWTHTVTKAVHFTTFKLALDTRDPTGTTYLYDGQPVKMSAKTVTVDVLQNNGTLAQRSKTFYSSKQGAVMVYPEAGVVWTATEATVLGDPNRNNSRMLDQWIAMGRAGSVSALKEALDKHAGLPWVNTVAADRYGNAMYADASVVPLVTSDKFVSDCFLVPALLTFDGSRSACAWGNDPKAPAGIFSPTEGPSLIRTDYVANSNDSYWLSNARHLLTGPAPLGYSPLYGPTDVEQSLRTRIAFRQLEQMITERGRLVVGDLQTLAFANRIYAAELVLPELLPLCLNSPDQQIAAACSALNAWDRKADLESRGAVLFREFWNLAADIPGLWQVPLDVNDPVNTPRSLAPSATPALLAALKSAAQQLTALNIPFNGRLGDYQDDTRNGVRVPVHGGIGDIDGSFNSIHMRTGLTATGYHDIIWGTSYVQTVTFDNAGPIAYAMLTYGQSVDPKNPHYADQLPLYSRKEFPQLPFTPEKIRADPAYQLTRLRE